MAIKHKTPLIDAAFILVVLIFFQPVKDRVDDLIARLFLRDRSDPRAILETFSRQVASIFDIADLKVYMLSVMTEQLFVERAFFVTRDPSRKTYAMELAGLSGEIIDSDDWFFAEALRRGRPSAFEEFVMEKVQNGETIIGLYPLTDEKVQSEFEQWKEKFNGAIN